MFFIINDFMIIGGVLCDKCGNLTQSAVKNNNKLNRQNAYNCRVVWLGEHYLYWDTAVCV